MFDYRNEEVSAVRLKYTCEIAAQQVKQYLEVEFDYPVEKIQIGSRQ